MNNESISRTRWHYRPASHRLGPVLVRGLLNLLGLLAGGAFLWGCAAAALAI